MYVQNECIDFETVGLESEFVEVCIGFPIYFSVGDDLLRFEVRCIELYAAGPTWGIDEQCEDEDANKENRNTHSANIACSTTFARGAEAA